LVTEGDDEGLTGEVEGDIQGVPGQTHVIYYIEDGAISRYLYKLQYKSKIL
jgi:hypothetical protein